MFSDCSLTAVVLLGLDLLICSLITNMFSDCSSFVRIGLLICSLITNMFSDCSSFVRIGLLICSLMFSDWWFC